jgi:glycosyltransferase involved in cell wall biosynthesis
MMMNTIQNKKRVLIFSLAYFPELVAGAEVAIKEITDRLGGNVTFDMITLRLNSKLSKFETIGNVNVYRIGFTKKDPSFKDLVSFPMYLNKILYPIMASFKAYSLHRKNKYNCLWAMMTYMGMVAVIARMLIGKIPLILTIQDGDNIEKVVMGRSRIKPFVFLIKKAFRDATIVQTISDYLSRWSVIMGAKKVVMVPNGIDLQKIKENISIFKKEADDIKEKYNIKKGDKILVTTSRLVYKNGVDILIKAMPFLPEEVKLLIVGDGPLKDELNKLTLELDLGKRVFFVGAVRPENVFGYLKLSDVFVRVSRSEGQGISFLEAMAMGVPIVAPLLGGIKDFLIDKETGLAVPPENPSETARKILILLRDEAVREIVIKNASNMIENKYNWDDIAVRFEKDVLDKVML